MDRSAQVPNNPRAPLLVGRKRWMLYILQGEVIGNAQGKRA